MIMLPHSPYIFGSNGEPINPETIVLSADIGTETAAYIDQLKFTNKKIQELVNKLLNGSDPPIIIIQSDHGKAFGFDWEIPSKEMIKNEELIRQQFSNLNAYYLPDHAKNSLYETITSVNSFRIIFNSYFGGSYELLDDKMYYCNNPQPYQFLDVTNILIFN